MEKTYYRVKAQQVIDLIDNGLYDDINIIDEKIWVLVFLIKKFTDNQIISLNTLLVPDFLFCDGVTGIWLFRESTSFLTIVTDVKGLGKKYHNNMNKVNKFYSDMQKHNQIYY